MDQDLKCAPIGKPQTALVPTWRLTERETGQQGLHFRHVKTPFIHQITKPLFSSSWKFSEKVYTFLASDVHVQIREGFFANDPREATTLYQEARGKVMKKVDPCPSLDSNQMRPLCRSTSS